MYWEVVILSQFLGTWNHATHIVVLGLFLDLAQGHMISVSLLFTNK